MMSKKTQIAKLKAEIKTLTARYEKETINESAKQIYMEKIAEKKKEIEKVSRGTKTVTPVFGAPIIADRSTNARNAARRAKMSDSRFRL